MNDTKTKITIDSENVPKIREWFQSGRGVKVWTNMEIASGHAQQVFTPADHQSAPNWRYGSPEDVKPWDFEVSTFTPVESFRGRFKAMYWGPWVADGTEKRAKRLCQKHGLPETSWRWEHDGMGYVTVTIGRIVITPFESEIK